MYIYEFLFRGGEASKTDDDTWHVILAEDYESSFEGTKRQVFYGPLTPAQADEHGYPLSRIVSELNQAAINRTRQLETLRDFYEERSARAAAEKDAIIAELRAQLSPDAEAVTEEKKSLLNTLSFGLLK